MPIGAVLPDDLIMFVGDTHGDIVQWKYLFNQADQFPEPIKLFVQLGDFGYWEHNMLPERYEEIKSEADLDHLARDGVGAAYLDRLSEMLTQRGAQVAWVDGNHENHTLLRALYGPGGPRYKAGGQGFWEVRPNIFYIPRGSAWIWGNTKFLGIGGAYSIDKDSRQKRHRDEQRRENFGHRSEVYEGISRTWECWWPEEMITDEEAQKAMLVGKVDVVLAHDCPDSVDVQMQFALKGFTAFLKRDTFSSLSRAVCEKILSAVEPQYWIHGHYHLRYTHRVPLTGTNKCQVEGLSKNGDGRDSYIVRTPNELLANS